MKQKPATSGDLIPPTMDSLKDERGQSLVEFVLLLVTVMLLSLGFMKGINSNIAKYWLNMAQVLVEDDDQRLELR